LPSVRPPEAAKSRRIGPRLAAYDERKSIRVGGTQKRSTRSLDLDFAATDSTAVGEYFVEDLAKRAGVEADYVRRLVDLGILTPDATPAPGEPRTAEGRSPRFASGDLRRVRVLKTLDDAGLPLEGIGELIRRGDLSLAFVDQPSYQRLASLGSETFRDVSQRTGVPVELLLLIREAMGSAVPQPDDLVREDEQPVVAFVKFLVDLGSRPPVLERSLRVYADSFRRIAETEGDWWRTEIQMPLIRAGHGPGELGELTRHFTEELSDLSDRAVLTLYHGQQVQAWMKNIFEGVEATLTQAGLHSRLDRPPAICFLDLTGYTRLTDERGDEAAAELAGRLSRLVQRTSGLHGGTAVKWLGDGVMFHFREPGQGALAAIEMVEAAEGDDLPPAHVGLHAGSVLFQEGDYFGRTVNVAARIADYARPGEVLVSQEVVDASDSVTLSFDLIGPVDLKGIPDPIRLHVARRTR